MVLLSLVISSPGSQSLLMFVQVYDELSSYFPEHMAQPRDNIVDMVKL